MKKMIKEVAEKALRGWEEAEPFPVSDIERHGFINGFKCGYRQLEAENKALKERLSALGGCADSGEPSREDNIVRKLSNSIEKYDLKFFRRMMKARTASDQKLGK